MEMNNVPRPRVQDKSAMRSKARPRVQKEVQDSPAMRTRSRARTITQQLLSAMEHKLPTRMKEKVIDEVYHYTNEVMDPDTGELLNYRQLMQHPKLKEDWIPASSNKFGRLAQGVGGRVEGTNTIFFIDKDDIPPDRRKDVTYGKFNCDYRPTKKDPNRMILTVGGNLINFPGDVGTPTADMLLVKSLLNSVISM